MNEDYLESIKKLATGYEYEEIQTQIEETSTGTKKKIIKTKKHIPPNFQAARYLLTYEKREPVKTENIMKFEKEVF